MFENLKKLINGSSFGSCKLQTFNLHIQVSSGSKDISARRKLCTPHLQVTYISCESRNEVGQAFELATLAGSHFSSQLIYDQIATGKNTHTHTRWRNLFYIVSLPLRPVYL